MRSYLGKLSLPDPTVSEYEWQLQASCRSMPVAMFYPPQSLRGYSLSAHEAEAKAVCSQCPVLESCRRHALEASEPYGIWGGLAPRERVVVR